MKDDVKSGASVESDRSDATSTGWRTYFPYDEPYEQQVDGIEGLIDVAQRGGFASMEGACGTGKTLIALVGGIALVRDPNTRYERVFCTTSVKQQLEAFVDDMEAINANLPANIESVRGLQVVGKADVCSWVDEGTLSNQGIYRRCNELRDPVWNEIGEEERRRNPDRGRRTALESLVEDKRVTKDDRWPPAVSGDDWTAPIRDEHHLRDGDDYCGFYARHLLNEMDDKAPFRFDGMMDTRAVIRSSSENGVCPHAALGSRLGDAEVVIGNYTHIFDRRTRNFTEGIIGPSTLAVFDEAHTMEPKVRGMLELSAGLSDFAAALEETAELLHILESTDPEVHGIKTAFQNEMDRWGLGTSDLRTFQNLIARASEWVADEAETALNASGHQLRAPDEVETDSFSRWIQSRGDDKNCLRAEYIGEAIERARDAAAQLVEDYPRENTRAPVIGQLLAAWVRRDRIDNYQSLELRRTDNRIGTHDRVSVSFRNRDWNGSHDPHLVLKNCIPRQIISDTLSEFGGGLLMSATLAPMDIYETAIGLDRIGTGSETSGAGTGSAPTPDAEGEDESEGDDGTGGDDETEATRDAGAVECEQFVYGMHFPPENRVSMAVDVPKFTYENRGKPEGADGAAIRRKYVRILRDVVTGVDGNILIAMPSYAEAQWATSALRGEWDQFDPTMQDAIQRAVDKQILVDESSSNEVTQTLKREFFSGDPKVLVTSLRGTLTEGVDFAGEKLEACVVCGVPIRSTGGDHADAIEAAYGRTFDGNGFESAYTIPAVRKARQALGRVIRSDSDVGVRVLADERYTTTAGWDSVREHIPEHARDEYRCVQPDEVSSLIEAAPTE